MKLSIVIPCYNESENLPKLLSTYDVAVTRNDIELLLVNNGSTDTTAEVLDELLPKYERFLKVVTVPVNQGYGYGVLAGLKVASGEFLGVTHGDLQTPPQDVFQALEIIEQEDSPEKLLVKGNRKGRPLFDQFFTACMSIFETIYLQTAITDTNAQPIVFHRSFYESWRNPPCDFAFDLFVLYMAKQNGLKIIRFPVRFPKRQHGESKWNTSWSAKWKFIKRTIAFSIKLKRENLS